MSDAETPKISPATTPFLEGHKKTAQIFLDSYEAGRLHHAWLIAGPRGIGKATLAYHLARFLLKQDGSAGPGLFGKEGPPAAKAGTDAFYTAEDDPLFMRVASGSEGNLKVIRRGYNEKTHRKRSEIVVDDVRALHDFFEMTAAHEGWRIAIIDSADAMNRSAANALLKMLEEPPKKSVLLLISHAKGRLVPTIKSRCQQLLLSPLQEEEVAEVVAKLQPEMPEGDVKTYAGLSGGSPGLALRLALFGGKDLFELISMLLSGVDLTTREKHAFATELGSNQNEEKYFLFLDLVRAEVLARTKAMARAGVAKTRLDCWVGLWEKIDRITGEGEGLNLGRKQMILLLLEDLCQAGAKEKAAA